jgi:hypothetical protein
VERATSARSSSSDVSVISNHDKRGADRPFAAFFDFEALRDLL